MNLVILTFLFPSLLVTENLKNYFRFEFWNFVFWRNFASAKKADVHYFTMKLECSFFLFFFKILI